MRLEDIRREDFKWNSGMLYIGLEYVGISLRSDMDVPELYYITTDAGESADRYNLSRAKYHGITLALRDAQLGAVHKGLRRHLDALKYLRGSIVA